MLNKVTKLHWLLVALFAILLSACSTTPDETYPGDTPSKTPIERPAQYVYAVELMKRSELDKAYGVLTELSSSYANADVYTNLAIIDFKRKKYDKAKENIEKSITANDKSAISRNIHGLILVYAGNVTQAETEYKNAIALDANYAASYLNLAIMYDIYLNSPTKALPYYEKYKEIADNNAHKDIDKWLVEVQRRAK